MNKYLKIVGGVFITILLGAIGSGVWQYILGPIVSNSTKAILDIATLGVDSFKNDLYMEIARGLHEEASYSVLVRIDTIYVMAVFIFLVWVLIKARELVVRRNKLLKKIRKIKEGVVNKSQSLDEIESGLNSIPLLPLKRLAYLSIFLAILIFTLQFVLTKSKIYINDAISHYRQSIGIIAPYISEREVLLYNSRFSQIKNQADYVNILKDLKAVSRSQNIELPEFDVW